MYFLKVVTESWLMPFLNHILLKHSLGQYLFESKIVSFSPNHLGLIFCFALHNVPHIFRLTGLEGGQGSGVHVAYSFNSNCDHY